MHFVFCSSRRQRSSVLIIVALLRWPVSGTELTKLSKKCVNTFLTSPFWLGAMVWNFLKNVGWISYLILGGPLPLPLPTHLQRRGDGEGGRKKGGVVAAQRSALPLLKTQRGLWVAHPSTVLPATRGLTSVCEKNILTLFIFWEISLRACFSRKEWEFPSISKFSVRNSCSLWEWGQLSEALFLLSRLYQYLGKRMTEILTIHQTSLCMKKGGG